MLIVSVLVVACLAASSLLPSPTFALSASGSSIRPLHYSWLQSWGDRLRGRRYLTLTFDDGPYGDGLDERLLQTLERHQADAIFFIVCHHLPRADKTLWSRALHDGDLLGNHSFDHAQLAKLGLAALEHEIGDCSDRIAQESGQRPAFFRPPFGQTSPAVRSMASTFGMQEMRWDANSQDSWQTRPEQIQGWVDRQSDNFSILLMHSKPTTVAVLDRVLTGLESRGFRFVLPVPSTEPPSGSSSHPAHGSRP